jgi:DNA-binding CsgD family transcriptional regulator
LRGKAARLDIELGILNRRCSLLKRTLDRVPLAVAVVERTGRVIEMNRLADRLVQQDEVLCLRQCQLHAVNNDDDCALAKLVAQATAEVGRMLLANVNGLPRFLTVVPLGVDASGGTGAAGAILVSGQTGDLIPEQPLRALFGLSVAEGRLAVAVASGMRLTDFAALHGVRITTLRTQLSAILRKFRAQRQSDIVRLLLSAAAAGVSSEATSPDVPVDPAVT